MQQIDLSVDYPAECARKVIQEEVDLGIIPIAALLNIPNAHVISDYCIGTEGNVDSVFIFSDKPIMDIDSIRLDTQSRTSNGLARILLKYYWKREVKIVEDGKSDAYVLIGDRTFGKKDTVSYAYDLGYHWKQFTGLPFAFAVWVSNKKLPVDFVEEFNQALSDGVRHAVDVIADLPPHENFDYVTYLTKSLDFHLTDKKREAISKYLELYKTL